MPKLRWKRVITHESKLMRMVSIALRPLRMKAAIESVLIQKIMLVLLNTKLSR